MSERVPTNCTECDGCTWSVLEYEEGSRDRAFHASGWFHDLHTGWDLCPACRPDSPFTAVKRVRAQVQAVRDVTVPIPYDVYDFDSYLNGAVDALIRVTEALDGERGE